MRYETPPLSPAEKGDKSGSERREEALVSRMADAAAKLLKDEQYDAPHHIWQAISGIGIRTEAERSAYFSKVSAELRSRATRAKKDDDRREKRAEAAHERLARQLRNDAGRSSAAKYEAEEREREDEE